MPEIEASMSTRGGESTASEQTLEVEGIVRTAVERFGVEAVSAAFHTVQVERGDDAAIETIELITKLVTAGGVLTLQIQREIIAQTGIDRRAFQQVLNRLIWRKHENETGILELKVHGLGMRVDTKDVAERFKTLRESAESL